MKEQPAWEADLEDLLAEIKELTGKINMVFELKEDGEDIFYEREEAKDHFEIVSDNYKKLMKEVPEDQKETVKKQVDSKVTKLKTLLNKL